MNEQEQKKSEWVEIDPTIPNQIPDEHCFIYTIEDPRKVVFVAKGNFIPLNFCTHYKIITMPNPPLINQQ